MLTRQAAVAGTFYPAEAQDLDQHVTHLLQQHSASNLDSTDAPYPKALIVPHAGYVYSGPTAAIAYRLLTPFRSSIKRVVLLGLSHRIPFRGIATTSAQYFETPLGEVKIDRSAIDTLIKKHFLIENDDAHRWEHSLEVQLPFLQKVLDNFSLIPLATGDCSSEDVGRCLDYLWGEDDTLILISSDLSHFHPYQQAQVIDRDTCNRILQKEDTLVGEQACGCRGINGLLHFIRSQNFRIELLDYRNSGDTGGDKTRVVGYGAFAVYQS